MIFVLIVIVWSLMNHSGGSGGSDKLACQSYNNFLNYHGTHETHATHVAWLQRAASTARTKPLKADLDALADVERYRGNGMGHVAAAAVAGTTAAVSDCRNHGYSMNPW
ncbi:MAG: hypothetical protein ACTHJW_17065 [Streptosporangiaceae bacterium]